MNLMSDRFFIDTNIFVYSFDKSDTKKQETAKGIISHALDTFSGCISYQVIQEFLNVATQKFKIPLTRNDCHKYLEDILAPLCEIFSSINLYKDALEIKEGWQYSFYDSVIIGATLYADCKILYSEDLQHQQTINSLTIVNPFL